MAPVVDREKCKGCGTCRKICPEQSIMMRDDKAYITIDCVQCGQCVTECPEQAIH